METVRYELISRPSTFVDVPADYAGQAREFVEMTLERPSDFIDALRRDDTVYPFLENVGILGRTEDLMRGVSRYDSLSLQDILYLRICAYGCIEKRESYGDEARVLENSIIEVIRSLEEPEE